MNNQNKKINSLMNKIKMSTEELIKKLLRSREKSEENWKENVEGIMKSE